MVYQASLVCEGGAMAGVYTAGVLDVLMEHDIYFSHVIGVSVGSCNAIDYVSGQIGRTIDCIAVKDKHLAYSGPRCLLRCGRLYDFNLCFRDFPEQYFPFDYEAFGRSPIYIEVVATDCETGEPLFIRCKAEGKQVMRASRASSSMPFLSEIYEFEGHKCLDGGVAKSIPIDRAISFGNEKIIVILTKPAGYRKTPNGSIAKAVIRKKYRAYPKLQAALNHRYMDYNTDIERVEKMADSGELYLFRPPHKLVSRHESNYGRLRAGYDIARENAEQQVDGLLDYLKK